MRKLAAAMLILCGCNDPGLSDLAILNRMQASYVDTNARWTKKQLTVCFMNPLPEHEEARSWVRVSVDHGWDRHIALDFVWKRRPCEGDEDIRIRVADEQPYAMFGPWKELRLPWVATIVLNFDFYKWSKVCRQDELTKQLCIMGHAAHEFGHSLGFIHEQNRPDTPAECLKTLHKGDLDGFRGDYMSLEWDKYSVMNYCSDSYEPSAEDIATAISIYGAEKP